MGDVAGRQPEAAQERDHDHAGDARFAEADHAGEPFEGDRAGHGARVGAQHDQHLRREQRGRDGEVRLDGGQVEEARDRANAEGDLDADQHGRDERQRAQAGPPDGAPPGDDRRGEHQQRDGHPGQAMERLDQHGRVRVGPERAAAERDVGAGERGARMAHQAPEQHLEIDGDGGHHRHPRHCGRRRGKGRGIGRDRA